MALPMGVGAAEGGAIASNLLTGLLLKVLMGTQWALGRTRQPVEQFPIGYL